MTAPDRCSRCGQRSDDWPDGEGGMLCQACWDATMDEWSQKLLSMKPSQTEKSERKDQQVDRCRTIKGVHIPGCIGCAVYGHDHCTCERAPRQTIESRYQEALAEIAQMGTSDMSPTGYELRRAIQIARVALEPAKRKGK